MRISIANLQYENGQQKNQNALRTLEQFIQKENMEFHYYDQKQLLEHYLYSTVLAKLRPDSFLHTVPGVNNNQRVNVPFVSFEDFLTFIRDSNVVDAELGFSEENALQLKRVALEKLNESI